MPPEREISDDSVRQAARVEKGAEDGLWHPVHPQHIGRLEAAGQFPKRVQLGPNRVAWLLSEVDTWLNKRIAIRDASFDEQASF